MKKLTLRAMRTIHVLVIIALVAGLMPSAPPALASTTQATPTRQVRTEAPAHQTGTRFVDATATAASLAPSPPKSDVYSKTTLQPAQYYYAVKVEETARIGTGGGGQVEWTDAGNATGPQDGAAAQLLNSSHGDKGCIVVSFGGTLGLSSGQVQAYVWQPQGPTQDMGMEISVANSIVGCSEAGWTMVYGYSEVGGSNSPGWYGGSYTGNVRALRVRVWSGGGNVLHLPRYFYIDSIRLWANAYWPDLPSDRTHAPEDPCLANNPQASAADPVNTRSGNFTHQAVDVAIPTRGLPLTFERSYNSLDTYAGPLGRGWTHSFNMHLTVEGDTATLMAPRGSRLRFTDQGGGTFTAGAGVRATLVRHGDGTYTLTRGDQLVYIFSAAGRLTALADTQANTTTLTYSGDNLTAITAPDGRALTLSYDGQGRLTQLTDPLNRTVGYTYDGGNLASVTDRRGGVTHYAYDAEGRLTSFSDANGHTVANSYDGQGRVSTQTDALGQATTFAYGNDQTVVTDRNGQATTHTYDATGRLESVADPLGQTTHYTYDEDHNLATVTDPLGRTTHFTWSDCGCSVTSVTDPLNQTTRFVYDGRNNLVSQTDPLSRTTTFAYDGQDNLTVITNTLGLTVTFAYDAYGQLRTSTDANGHTSGYAYDAYGNLALITDTLSQVTRLSYDLAGRLVQITDPQSQITHYAYDAGDNLLSVTDALNGETSYGYDAIGNTTAITDANGHTTAFDYDAADRLTTVTNPLGHATRYGYDAAGNLTQITDPQSQITNYQYDAAHRLTAVVDPLGNATGYGYGTVGNLTVITDANGLATHYGHDALNRLVSVTDALGGLTSYGYDAVGSRTVITDANGHVSRFTYDDLNRLASRADPLNHTWVYGYDPVGNLIQLTDPQSQITNYQYDALNRLTGMDYPAPQGDVSFSYDAVGNRLSMTDPTGSTSYVYDALNRLTSVAHPGNQTVGYGYDAVGNRTQMVYPGNKTVTYAYNAANRLAAVTDWSSGWYTYTYDAAGQLTGLSAPNGVRSSYHYDKAGRLTCLDHATQDETLASYRYSLDGVGNRLQAEEGTSPCWLDVYLPLIMKDVAGGTMGTGGEEGPSLLPGLFTSPLPDPFQSPLPSPTPTPTAPERIEDLMAALDSAYQQGQIDNEGVYNSLRAKLTQAQDYLNQGQTSKAVRELEAFIHQVETQRGKHITAEAADQLIALAQQIMAQLQAPTSRSAGLASPLSNHPQSPIPNPQSQIPNPTVVTYTYDSLYRLTAAAYSSGESFAYTYDAVGNRLSLVTGSGSTSYAYDAADRLTSVNGVGYTWDDNGNLLSDGTRTFTYDAADRLVGVSGGGVNASYTYNGDGLRVGQTINGQGTTFTWDVAAALPQVLATSNGAAYLYGLSLLAQQQSGAWQYPLPDGLGSLRQWTDASRQVTYAARYAPFGSLLWQQGTAPGPWGFAGEFQDTTGLIYLRARWYDPVTGRFLTRDPVPGLVANPASLHPYVYTYNNPINFTDPNGQYIESWLDILFIAYDIGSISWDVYQLQQAGGCEKQDLYRQLGIDVGALLLDVAFLALPGVTGGGPGLRLALAGGGHLTVAGAVRAGRAVQAGYKGVQVGGQIAQFAASKRGGGDSVPSWLENWHNKMKKAPRKRVEQELKSLRKTLAKHEEMYRHILESGGRSQEIERMRLQIKLLEDILRRE